jgi:hypothetical protein
VNLDHSNWQKHLTRHPEVVAYHDKLMTVLTDPDVVIEANRDGHFHFYRSGLTDGPYRRLYIRVVVEYYGDKTWGTVKTAILASTVDVPGIVRRMRLPRS